MKSSSGSSQQTYLIIGALAIAAGIAVYLSFQKKRSDDKPSSSNSGITPTKSNVNRPSAASSSTSKSSTTAASSHSDDDKNLHRQIEEIDREGKALYKDKRYTEAASCFTKALDLIDASAASNSNSNSSNSLTRQIITLTNNRSAMYEKASLPDLALSDCEVVLSHDPSHIKARSRKLRILESLQRYPEALIEVCALQLKYMADNRDKLRLGLPPSQPAPVSQGKIEELVVASLPEEMERVMKLQSEKKRDEVSLPSTYTIVQLLKSFSGYNKWMGEAAKGGMVDVLTLKLEEMEKNAVGVDGAAIDVERIAQKSILLYQRGRRYAFEKKFENAVSDFDGAYNNLVSHVGDGSSTTSAENLGDKKKEMIKAMGTNEYCRLLEWEGMCRHLRYDLKGALECYQECSELEPENTELLVKQAGVKMDGTNHADAEKLFAKALELNPNAPDALLHRANLRMIQQRVADAESDLQTCVRLYPNNLLARLRLATVFMAKEDMSGAKRVLDEAAECDPDSSEVHCYRGELHFAQGEFDEAKSEFEKAMKCDNTNPTPYVNSALAVMNTPPTSGAMMPDFPEAISLLEKAIDIDPMFHSAYVQLGQMKLAMATDLTKAREVVELYDRGLEYCRTPEELKDICSMRMLTLAQVDAAHALNMESLNMQ
ncbi:hypothetical protein ACHAWO_002171 [Cyclotella atomus]|uniref:Ancillary SecYEG translocon subunit/Cell division coordinator CpoB TPR domain-containing protein n=1 Tax=Cyclotella atomus TaxID=382360 RepID=A0ABD3QM28_9STRA